MLKSRAIRAAVNLCLIGALLAPAAGFASLAWEKCGEQVASNAKCPGCGCCAVADSGGRCGCCDRTAVPRQKRAEIHHSACCADELAEEASLLATNAPTLCLCGNADPAPAVPPAKGLTATEQLIRTLLVGSPAVVGMGPAASAFASCWDNSAVPRLLPRDAQRRLGVWRI